MVLVDTSVWVSFLKGEAISQGLLSLIDANVICTNDLILAELVPSLKMKKEHELIEMLGAIDKLDLAIDWKEIISFQTYNLKHGINKVGIPDLVIAQNSIQNRARLFSYDKHFSLMKQHLGLKMYED